MLEVKRSAQWLEWANKITLAATSLVLPVSRENGAIIGFTYVFCSILLIFAWARTPTKNEKPSRPAFFLLLLGTSTALATLLSAWSDWFFGSVSLLVIVVAISGNRLTEFNRLRIFRFVVIVSIAESVIGFVQFVSGSLLYRLPRGGLSDHAFVPGALRAEGSFGQPLVFAIIMAIGLMLLINVAGFTRGWTLVGAVMLSLGVIASGSASALVACAIGLVLSFARRQTISSRFLLTGVLSLLSIGVLVLGLFPVEFLKEFSVSNNAQRVESWQALPRLLSNQEILPLTFGNGWGAESYLQASGLIKQSASHALDLQFVSCLGLSGIVGFFLLLSFILSSLSISRRAKPEYFPVLACIFMLFFSFDVLSWAAPSIILATLVSASVPKPLRMHSRSFLVLKRV